MGAGGRRDNNLAGNLTRMGDLLGRIGRFGHAEEATHMVGERFALIAGLRSTKLLQARWPVAGEHDKRHPRRFRLHDRRVIVGKRRAGSANHAHRTARCLRNAQRKESGTALVDIKIQVEGRTETSMGFVGNHRKRGGPRAGAYHHIAHSRTHQLIEKRTDISAQCLLLLLGVRFALACRR